jgi:hypothetical protein
VGGGVLQGVPVKDDPRWSEAEEVANRENLVRTEPFLAWFVQCPAASESDRRMRVVTVGVAPDQHCSRQIIVTSNRAESG